MSIKKTGIAFVTMLIASALVFVYSASAFAAAVVSSVSQSEYPTVTLENDGSGVEFTINRENSDLFDNFKDVMPGQKLEQKVVIKSTVDKRSGGDKFDIFMYARNSVQSASHPDIYDNVEIKVFKNNIELKVLEADSGVKGVYLGRFNTGDSIKLDVEMTVPLSLGNEYQNAEGIVEWTFYAQQYIPPYNPPETEVIDDPDPPGDEPPVEKIEDLDPPLDVPTKPPVPTTGDVENIVMLGVITSVSGIALIFLIAIRASGKKKKTSN